MVSDTDCNDVISWAGSDWEEDVDAIYKDPSWRLASIVHSNRVIVHDLARLQTIVLPHYYDHSSLQKLVQQLTGYGFRMHLRNKLGQEQEIHRNRLRGCAGERLPPNSELRKFEHRYFRGSMSAHMSVEGVIVY